MRNTPRSLLAIVGGIVGLVAIAVGIVVLAGNSRQLEFPPGTPEATIQDYLAAWEDGDYELAFDAFSVHVRGSTTPAEYRRMATGFYGGPEGGPRRAVYIDRVTGSGDRVRVELTVEEFYGEGLGGSSYRDRRSIGLVSEDGAWKIDEPLLGLEHVEFEEFNRF